MDNSSCTHHVNKRFLEWYYYSMLDTQPDLVLEVQWVIFFV